MMGRLDDGMVCIKKAGLPFQLLPGLTYSVALQFLKNFGRLTCVRFS
jgi:hypothetical protein